MKVIDRETGCTLESEDKVTIEAWVKDAERYVPVPLVQVVQPVAREKKPRAGKEPCM